ncbi:hypothetical protein GCM10029964_045120 [Kibdelosporangium lantanae]
MTNFAYRPWHDGPDPLAPPVDIRAALDQIGRDVMEGSSPRSALEELLRQGVRGTRGLDDMTRRLWRERSRLQRRHRLDGTLQEVQRLLEEALEAEKRHLFPDPSDDARFREAQLDALPSGTAAQVRELANYDWQSPQAREAYQKIQDMLGQELMESRFRGMKEALRNATPEDVERVREMMSDLNDLLAAHARGDDTQAQFDQFMNKHGEFFPENPGNVEELIDALAARAAAAQRMMNSMSAEQRAELSELVQQAFGDPRLASEVSRLDAQLQALRPGRTGRARAASVARTPSAWARAPRRCRTWPKWTRWPSNSASPTRARGWRTSTWRRWNANSARKRRWTPAAWPSWNANYATRACWNVPPTARCNCHPRRCGAWGRPR